MKFEVPIRYPRGDGCRGRWSLEFRREVRVGNRNLRDISIKLAFKATGLDEIAHLVNMSQWTRHPSELLDMGE